MCWGRIVRDIIVTLILLFTFLSQKDFNFVIKRMVNVIYKYLLNNSLEIKPVLLNFMILFLCYFKIKKTAFYIK